MSVAGDSLLLICDNLPNGHFLRRHTSVRQGLGGWPVERSEASMKDVPIALLGSGFVGDFYMQGSNYSSDRRRQGLRPPLVDPRIKHEPRQAFARSDIDLYNTQPLADSITCPVSTPTQQR